MNFRARFTANRNAFMLLKREIKECRIADDVALHRCIGSIGTETTTTELNSRAELKSLWLQTSAIDSTGKNCSLERWESFGVQ